ncbi:hypothetical protein BKA65DRAFT_570915 [Rhexocercosporidium sp. MPI-PUGE-AT-0058]|nr:hypothetical protein BKA65DRAFT_570915 [Rhexocercosporidium sp. MPI-PUGE-AT-0058]
MSRFLARLAIKVSAAISQHKKEFFDYLIAHSADIENLVRCHLGINWCHVCVMEIWKSGSFNVWHDKVFVRFPLPYKLGEANNPGNLEEKLRTEVAAYIWLQEQCPDVSIPIYTASFTHPRNAPFFAKTMLGVRRLVLSWLGFLTPCNYVRHGLHNPFKSGYIILSEAKGEPLHRSWEDHRHDKSYRTRLFRGLARISLSLNEKLLSQIGLLTLDLRGVITLPNWPLTLYLQMLENEGTPSGIPRQRTYRSVGPYISDLLSFQDNRILYQPNSVHNQDDGEMQFAALTALRATMHRFIRPEYRDGPFFFTLTDLHRSNIFPPYWLASKAVKGFGDSESVAELDTLLKEYFAIYEEENARNGILYQAPVMRHVWEAGSFWYFQAIKVPKGMYRVFNSNIQPLFNKEHCEESIFDQVFWWYWTVCAQEVKQKKIKDKEDYTMQLSEAFGTAGQDKTDHAKAD